MRPFGREDARDAYELNLDPEVLKYTGDEPFESVDAARVFLENYDQHAKYQVGRLAVIEKRTEKFIGWCGLKYHPESDEYDIGFRFKRSSWGLGLATETAQRCLAHGFQTLEIPVVMGRAMYANTASINVLDKLGMTFAGEFDFDGQSGVVYSISKADFSLSFPKFGFSGRNEDETLSQ